jgi:hypothetical protein
MNILYSSKTGAVTIRLSDAEVRQFQSSQAAVEVVRKAIDGAKRLAMTGEPLCVDGHVTTDSDSPLQGDGQFPPFWVFDPDKQDNVAGPFDTREKANEEGRKLAAEQGREFVSD